MTEAHSAESPGAPRSVSWAWTISGLIWLVLVVAGSIWIWQSTMPMTWGHQPIQSLQPIRESTQWGEQMQWVVGTEKEVYTIEDKEAIYVDIRAFDTDLIHVETPPRQLQQNLRTVQVAGTATFALLALLLGVAFRTYCRWGLHEWVDAPHQRVVVGGGLFVYGPLSVAFAQNAVPKEVHVNLVVGIVLVLATYALIVVALAAVRQWLEGKQGVWAMVGRGVFGLIAVLCALVILGLALFALGIKILAGLI